MQTQDKTALVLGATGGIGGEVTRQLRDSGWHVRALSRRLSPPQGDGIEWLQGDAMQASDVLAAASGCGVIVHAVNPPGYRDWDKLVLPMLAHSMAAAEAVGATLVLPGTVYNYGADAFPLVHEDAPQRPTTRKGAIRVAMERQLREAAEGGRLRAIVLRAGDFFGPRNGNSWFTQAMVQAGRPVTTVKLPATPGVGHQFAYLPDVARTLLALLARRASLPRFVSLHMAGHWDADGRQLGLAVQRAVVRSGAPAPRLQALPWWQLRLAAPFVPMLRELLEMRYLWQQEIRLDNRELLKLLGEEPHTPLDEAVTCSLAGIGCLPAVDQALTRRITSTSQSTNTRSRVLM